MNAFTKYEALLGELEPYTPSDLTIKKSLADVGINDIGQEYAPESDKRPIALAAISVLQRLIVLASDSMGKTSQSYDVDKLEKRIRALCEANGLDASDYVKASSISDGSNMW